MILVGTFEEGACIGAVHFAPQLFPRRLDIVAQALVTVSETDRKGKARVQDSADMIDERDLAILNSDTEGECTLACQLARAQHNFHSRENIRILTGDNFEDLIQRTRCNLPPLFIS